MSAPYYTWNERQRLVFSWPKCTAEISLLNSKNFSGDNILKSPFWNLYRSYSVPSRQLETSHHEFQVSRWRRMAVLPWILVDLCACVRRPRELVNRREDVRHGRAGWQWCWTPSCPTPSPAVVAVVAAEHPTPVIDHNDAGGPRQVPRPRPPTTPHQHQCQLLFTRHPPLRLYLQYWPFDNNNTWNYNKSAQSKLGTGRVAAGCPGRGRCSTAP